LHDLFAKSCQKPLYKLLGGAKPVIETDITISVNPVEQMVADSLSAVAEGYNILKVKVGKEGFADVARMEAIRRAVGPETVLRVDANQGWEAKQAVRIIRAMEDKGLEIELVEQPVPAHNLAGMRYITQNVSTPVLADESVFSAADAVEIIRAGAADLINIKLMKTGGIHEALRICAIAESFGVGCMVGCMLESHISVGAAAHLAAARRVCTMADLDGPSLCAENPYTGGPEYNGPNIVLSNQPGIGVVQVPGFENKG
ncbi:MAG: dipeptide epimerase, partial [Oscillospiraceae bacterium]